MNRSSGVALAVASAVAVSGSVCAIAFRPRLNRWVVTDGTVRTPRAGDESASPRRHRPTSSRDTGVDAPPAEVWPWLV
jgi:hypothetical protein